MTWTIEVYGRRMLVTMVLLSILAYVTPVTALYYWLSQKPFNQVTWFDLAAPWKWSSLDKKRGDGLVLSALDDIEKRKYMSAFFQLRMGIARSPGNVKGRLTMAEMLINADPAHAVTVLEEGIPDCTGDEQFVQVLVSVYNSFLIQAHAVEKITELLENKEAHLSSASRVILERALFKLYLQLDRADEAQARLPSWRALDEDQAVLCEVELLLKAGRAAEAAVVFDKRFDRRLGEPAVAAMALDIGVALGQAERVQSVLLRLKVSAPDNMNIYLFALQAWARMKRMSYFSEVESEYLSLFGQREEALHLLASLGIGLDMPDLVKRTQSVAESQGFSPFAFKVILTEIALRKRDVDQAMQYLTTWEKEIGTLKKQQRFYPEFIRRLTWASFTGDDEDRSRLVRHMADNRVQASLPVYTLAAQVLGELGDTEGISRLIQSGLMRYPMSDPLLNLKKSWADRIAAAKRAPTREEKYVRELPSTAEDVRKLLKRLPSGDAWVTARYILRVIRGNNPPAWLTEMEPEISLQEVELACATLDPLASRTSVRAYLDRYRSESEAMALTEVAARLVKKDMLQQARLIKDELDARWAGNAAIQQELVRLNLGDDLAAPTSTKDNALAALDLALGNENWIQVERILKYLRAKPPAWAADAEVDIKLRELRLRLGLEQPPLALAALKELVIKPGQPRDAAIAFVRELVKQKEVDQAYMLAREVDRLLPGDATAQDLMKTAEVAREAGFTKDELEANLLQQRALRDADEDLVVPAATLEAALATLDGAMAERDWEKADRLLKYLKKKPPAWAADAFVELKLREVRLRLGLQQPPLALANFKELVIKPGAPRDAAFKLVRETIAQKDFDRARLLAREINRLMPGDQSAKNLLQSIEAARESQ